MRGGKGEKVVRVHEAFGRWEMMLHQRQTKQPVQWPWHPKEERILERTFGVGSGDFLGFCGSSLTNSDTYPCMYPSNCSIVSWSTT